MNALIQHLRDGHDLDQRQVNAAAELLLAATVADDKKFALLEALAKKGETPKEIAEFVEAFLAQAIDPELNAADFEGPTIDVCGTGGDQLNLFNVSSTAMFIVAAAGATVVKHGNRGITSKSGGADVLEALGIRTDVPVADFRRCLHRAGIGFLFAPVYHPAFKAVTEVRKQLATQGVRTIFNIIGPLLNPARPQCQLVGVFNPEWCATFAEILQRLGRDSAWVVHGTTSDKRSVDEVSLMGPTQIFKSGLYQDLADEEVHPKDFGMKLAKLSDLQGGDAKVNAAILEGVLKGHEMGAKRQIVLLNAGAAITCAGLADTMADGVELAGELIDDGSALERLRLLQAICRN